jgi:uncharacterized protein DUF4440
MKHPTLSAFYLCVTLFLGSAFANAAALPPDLAKAVADYDAAQIKGDGPELKRLLADDYTLLNSSGAIETKAQLIADYTAPGYKNARVEAAEVTANSC